MATINELKQAEVKARADLDDANARMAAVAIMVALHHGQGIAPSKFLLDSLTEAVRRQREAVDRQLAAALAVVAASACERAA